MRAFCSLVYLGLPPRPAAIESAARPWALKRLTSLPTLRASLKPATPAACEKDCLAATESSAWARCATSLRSLLALTIRRNSRSSCSLKGRSGWFWGCAIGVFLLSLPSFYHLRFPTVAQLLADPLVSRQHVPGGR